MERKLLITLVLTSLIPLFTVNSHASIKKCDVSLVRGGGIDGRDLAQFAAYYALSDSRADVNESGIVDSADVAHFAGFFGDSYRLPNILLIVGDDIGLDVTTDMYPGLIESLESIYGIGSGVRGLPASTPVLNTLAQQGMRFGNAWAHPFCSPTRATIMTGMYAAKHNVKNYQDPLGQNHTTFVQRLKNEANYSTAAFGKWHIAGFPVDTNNGMMPKQAGFELYIGGLGPAPSSYWNSYEYVVQDDTTTDTGTRPGNLQPRTLSGIAATTYAPVVKAADVIDWINEKDGQNPDKPWFAYFAFNLSHGVGGNPLMVVPNRDTLDCDENGRICEEIEDCNGVFGSTSIGSCTGVQLMRAMTTSMDTVLGKVLEAADSILSDTYVIYISDNGTPMYEGSYQNDLGYQIGNMYMTTIGRGKGTAYQSGAWEPLVIKGPGIAVGSASSEFVHAADLFPTCLELAGLEVAPEGLVYQDYQGNPTDLDGVSLTPILFGRASTVRDQVTGYILTETSTPGGGPFGQAAIKVGARNARYKVIRERTSTGSNTYAFYDLLSDPLEEGDPASPLGVGDDCENYDIDYGTGDARWHYCHLKKMIDDNSIF